MCVLVAENVCTFDVFIFHITLLYVHTGRELAAELSSTVQPLQHVASVLAEKMTAFLQQSLLVSHEE